MTLRRVLLIGDEQTLVSILSSCVPPVAAPSPSEQESDLGGAPEGLPDLVVLNLQPGADGRALAQCLQTNDPDRAPSVLNLGGQNGSPRNSRPTQLPELSQRSSGQRPALARSPSTAREEERPRGERGVIQHIGVVVDRERHSVHFDGRDVAVTPAEFRLLECFLMRPGRAFTRTELVKEMWPDKDDCELRIVDQSIKFLRRKLGRPDLIETVHGIGYRFREGPLQPA
jgi:Transcriptional regulatory protein, C terminal